MNFWGFTTVSQRNSLCSLVSFVNENFDYRKENYGTANVTEIEINSGGSCRLLWQCYGLSQTSFIEKYYLYTLAKIFWKCNKNFFWLSSPYGYFENHPSNCQSYSRNKKGFSSEHVIKHSFLFGIQLFILQRLKTTCRITSHVVESYLCSRALWFGSLWWQYFFPQSYWFPQSFYNHQLKFLVCI